MKGESYYRAQQPGSHRPAIGPTMMVNDNGTTSPLPHRAQPKRKRRDPMDVALKIVGGLLVWAGVFVAFMALYAGIIRLLGGG